MKTTLNVIRTGLAASLCISLLAACDGRGATAFKSHRYTPEQYAERTRLLKEKAARDANNGAELPPAGDVGAGGGSGWSAPKPGEDQTPRELPGAPSGPVAKTPAEGSGDTTTKTPADPAAPVTPGTQKDANGKPTLGPESKYFAELGKLEEDQREIEKRDDLTALVDKELTSGPNAKAAAILKEISFSKPGKDLEISLKTALLTKEGQERFLFVEGEPVYFAKDGAVLPLNSELHESREMKGEPILKRKTIFTRAYCPKGDCKFVHVLFKFASDSEPIYAAFLLEVQAENYKIVAHNLGPGLKAFAEPSKADVEQNKGQQTNVGEAAIVGHEVAAFTDGETGTTTKGEDKQKAETENQKPEQKVETQKVDTKNDKAQVRQGETFAEYNERRKQEIAANPLNLPEQPATVAELAKAGVAPASADLFAISSGAVDKFEFKPASTATADSGKGPTVAAAAALPAKTATVAVATADGSMARAAQLRGEERTQEAAAAAAAINTKMAQQKSIRYNTKAKVADGSMASAAQLRAQERNQEAVAAAPKSNVTYAELKSVADARLQERKKTAAAAAAQKVQTADAAK